MEKVFNLAIRAICMFALVGGFGGCEPYDDSAIWDKLNDHEERIADLEILCKQFNDNIESLQSIVKVIGDNDYITNIVSIMEGGKEVGYTITFSKSGTITIYHGKDGKDGNDGEKGNDGQTPIMGIKKDADGVYYWTLSGDWLLDEDGNKIPAIGNSGKDGETGEKGEDGITPQLKIEEDYWYVSYDNGISWQLLGKAVGEGGKDGEDGKDGDSMFNDVEVTDDYVIITLADGSVFKIPSWKAFEELASLVNQLNSNLSALQVIVEALQNNDYVTNVMVISDGNQEIGYTINFSKSGSVTIYHGKDGQKGEDGKSPVIGVKKDTDGTYYWTLNGDWLLDEDGNKIPAIGNSGKDGETGEKGEDGITPQFKIESEYWHISYDNGITWQCLGKATGEDGEKGNDGDSMFSDVEVTDYYVIVTLADGTSFKTPTWKAYEVLNAIVDMANTNISSLQIIVSALQSNDYVTGVVPKMDGNEIVGYILTFAKSGTIVISNGKDGNDGVDAVPPVINVKEDEDGIYYWTVNGEWLKDEDGNKIPTTGSPGTAGNDGIIPRLRIVDDYWQVSYDN